MLRAGTVVQGRELSMLLSAIVHKEDAWFVAECPEIGTASQGRTIEEAVQNLSEATALYLEEFPAPAPARPFLTTFDVSVHA